MYCPNCGTQITTSRNFCPNCGTDIRTISAALQSGSVRSQSRTQSIISTKVPAQKMQVRPGPHSRKCLKFALVSFIMGIVTGVIGLVVIRFLFIVGALIILITHIVGLTFGISAKKFSKEAAELEPPNSVEKAGSVFAVFGIIINAILMLLAFFLTIIFLIIIIT